MLVAAYVAYPIVQRAQLYVLYSTFCLDVLKRCRILQDDMSIGIGSRAIFMKIVNYLVYICKEYSRLRCKLLY